MVRRLDTAPEMGGDHTKMRICLPGAGIIEVLRMVSADPFPNEGDCMIVTQGGGNHLLDIGLKGTTEPIIRNMGELKKKRRELKILLCSILPRPRSGKEYEDFRRKINMELREVCKSFNEEGRRNGDGDVIFMNMDTEMKKALPRMESI